MDPSKSNSIWSLRSRDLFLFWCLPNYRSIYVSQQSIFDHYSNRRRRLDRRRRSTCEMNFPRGISCRSYKTVNFYGLCSFILATLISLPVEIGGQFQQQPFNQFQQQQQSFNQFPQQQPFPNQFGQSVNPSPINFLTGFQSQPAGTGFVGDQAFRITGQNLKNVDWNQIDRRAEEGTVLIFWLSGMILLPSRIFGPLPTVTAVLLTDEWHYQIDWFLCHSQSIFPCVILMSLSELMWVMASFSSCPFPRRWYSYSLSLETRWNRVLRPFHNCHYKVEKTSFKKFFFASSSAESW